MKKYTIPRSHPIDLYGESPLLDISIEIDPDEDVDDDDKTRRRNYALWDVWEEN
ncbi:MAG: hypothetical protein MJZ54_03320 [Bacteroidaceae bacterium]|nr:hypothetical protein [Bacteroidaceae bacterium]